MTRGILPNADFLAGLELHCSHMISLQSKFDPCLGVNFRQSLVATTHKPNPHLPIIRRFSYFDIEDLPSGLHPELGSAA